MKGTLYALGIGPGDPELMTLKAARLIKESPTLCVPRGKQDGESVALGIVKGAVDIADKRIMDVHFPMTKGSQRETLRPAAEQVLNALKEGDVAFITLGDPVLYSTFFHLYDAMLTLDAGAKVEIVPGVSSINASAARAGISLTLSGDKLAVLPATYVESLTGLLDDFDTVVLMKVHSVLNKVKKALSHKGLLNSATYVSRVGMQGEDIRPLSEIEQEDAHYFSTVIVRKKNG